MLKLPAISELTHHRLISVYLISAYLYYQHDVSFITDEQFDAICKRLLEEWDTIIHPHKSYVDYKGLPAGTAYCISKLPSIALSAAHYVMEEYDV